MTQQIDPDTSCSEGGCTAFRFDTDAALREGWTRVAGDTYCDLHSAYAGYRYARQVRDLELRARREALAAQKRREEAKKVLKGVNYRAWDQFQSDLANFHKEHGRLANERIRTLGPREFMVAYGVSGRIDIEEVEEQLDLAEKKAQATRQWLMER